MLDNREIKLVLMALSSHRTCLIKSLEDADLEEPKKERNARTTKQLDALIKKLATKIPAGKPGATSKSESSSQFKQENTSEPSIPTAKPERRKIEMANAHVLIAEDNPDSAVLLKSIIEDLGIKHIDIAADGKEAATMLAKCSPAYDLALLDWEMPEMSGIEVRQSVRSLAKLRDTHFMMVTAISETARIKQAVQNGIHDYLVKPVDEDVLEKKIKSLFLHEN